jgi:hypothetical protein
MMLSNYAITVLTSSFRWEELCYLIDSLKLIKYKHLYIGDVGLTEEHQQCLKDRGATVITLGYNMIGKPPTFARYKGLIRQRIPFLREVYKRHQGPILSLDTDTEIIKDDFKYLDTTADATMHVRGHEGPNCGVMFWHKPERCQEFWDAWEAEWAGNVPNGCPEQFCFNKALKTCQINWQELHCKYYNCIKSEWVNKDTSIIHYKGKLPNRIELKRLCAAF